MRSARPGMRRCRRRHKVRRISVRNETTDEHGSPCEASGPLNYNLAPILLWARTLWQDLFCAVVHGDWAGACTFGQEVEGLEAAAPDLHQERAALLNL
jgi:hypothetical protein